VTGKEHTGGGGTRDKLGWWRTGGVKNGSAEDWEGKWKKVKLFWKSDGVCGEAGKVAKRERLERERAQRWSPPMGKREGGWLWQMKQYDEPQERKWLVITVKVSWMGQPNERGIHRSFFPNKEQKREEPRPKKKRKLGKTYNVLTNRDQ